MISLKDLKHVNQPHGALLTMALYIIHAQDNSQHFIFTWFRQILQEPFPVLYITWLSADACRLDKCLRSKLERPRLHTVTYSIAGIHLAKCMDWPLIQVISQPVFLRQYSQALIDNILIF